MEKLKTQIRLEEIDNSTIEYPNTNDFIQQIRSVIEKEY